MRPKAFVCHSGRDKIIAQRIATDLLKEGIDIWIDAWEIKASDSISSKIRKGLEDAEYIIVLLSKSLLSSKGAMRELDSAIIRATYEKGIVIIPAKMDDTNPPADLADLHYANFSKSYEAGINKLKNTILGGVILSNGNIIMTLDGKGFFKIDEPNLLVQVRSAIRVFKEKEREIITRWTPSGGMIGILDKIKERIENFESEPEEWKNPELNLTAELVGMLAFYKEQIEIYDKYFVILLTGMINCNCFNDRDIFITLAYYSRLKLIETFSLIASRQSPNQEAVAKEIVDAWRDIDYRTKLVYGIPQKSMLKHKAGKAFEGRVLGMSSDSFSFYCPVNKTGSELSEMSIPFSGEWFSTVDWCKYALPQLASDNYRFVDVPKYINKNNMHICLDDLP